MSLSKQIAGWAILIFALFACIHIKGCSDQFKKKKHNYDKTEGRVISSDTATKLTYDENVYSMPKKHLQPKETLYIGIPAKVDTAEILKAFFSQYTYVDTLKDSNLLAITKVKVEQNRISDFNLDYKLLRPGKETIITNVVVPPAKSFLLVGARAMFNKTLQGLSPEVLFMAKNNKAYGLGYDVMNRSYSVSVYMPIKQF